MTPSGLVRQLSFSNDVASVWKNRQGEIPRSSKAQIIQNLRAEPSKFPTQLVDALDKAFQNTAMTNLNDTTKLNKHQPSNCVNSSARA